MRQKGGRTLCRACGCTRKFHRHTIQRQYVIRNGPCRNCDCQKYLSLAEYTAMVQKVTDKLTGRQAGGIAGVG